MSLTASVFFQGFFAEIEDQISSPGGPVIIANQGRVLDFCQRAARDGVREGQLTGHALSRCSRARIISFQADRYARWSQKARQAVEGAVISVEEVSANHFLVDPGPEPVQAMRSLRDLSIPAHRIVAVIAPGKFLARGLGLWYRRELGRGGLDLMDVSDRGRLRDLLGGIPVGFLSPCSQMSESLARLGIRTAGQVASLSSGFLSDRFGEKGYILSRLCQGRDGSSITPQESGLWQEERFDSEGEGTADERHIVLALDRIAAGLTESLDERGFQILRLTVRAGGRVTVKEWAPGRVIHGFDPIRTSLGNLWRKIWEGGGVSGHVAWVKAWAGGLSPAPSRQITLLGRDLPRQALEEVCSLLKSRFPVWLGEREPDRREQVLRYWDPVRFGDDVQ